MNITKSEKELAYEVIAGKWGNNEDRIVRLTNAGYNASNVQKMVNQIAAGIIEEQREEEKKAKEVFEIDVDLSKYGALVLNFTGVQ